MPTVRGGMEFRQGAIVRLPAPPRTLVAQPIRLTAMQVPQVTVGQALRRGQLLADPPDPSRSCLLSPMSGTVRDIRRCRAPHAADAAQQANDYQVMIEPNEPTMATALSTPPPRGRTLENWYEALRRFGPWSESDRRLDLVPQLHAARQRPPEALICVGMDGFAPYPDRSSLLASFPDDAVLGTQILADIVGAKRVLMVAPLIPAVLSRLKPSCRNFRVPLSAARNIYPSADPTLVLWAHAGNAAPHKLPPGAMPTDCGVVMIGPWTAIRLARWFTNGELDLARPLFIGWPEPGTPMTPCYALPGQPLASVHESLAGGFEALAGRVVLGNPMTGRPLAALHADHGVMDAVMPDDHQLLSILAPSRPPRAEACISCGWCAQVCPTELRPIRLVQWLDAQKPDKPRSKRLERNLRWCLDCGLCSHVCPSDLPLAQHLRAASAVNE